MSKNLLPIGETARLLKVSIDTLRRWDNSGKFKSIRIRKGGNRYYRRFDVDLFLKDPQTTAMLWLTSTPPGEPEPDFYCKTRDVFQARLEHFQTEVVKQPSKVAASLLSAIIGEIGNNTFDHNLGNWPDIVGLFFAYSLANRKIVLADRGLGILATLQKVEPKLSTHQAALTVAFTKTISARAPENRGNGLKFVKNIVVHNPIKLTFQSGDAHLILSPENSRVNVNLTENKTPGCLAVIMY